MKLIDISTRKHPNTFTMVDDADFEWLNQWKWHSSNGYAVRAQLIGGVLRRFYMHLEILKPPSGMKGDHRFGNRLDNRRENLRICTHTENMRNRKPTASRVLPKGVYWHPRNRQFMAQIMVDYRSIYLGLFPTAPEAEAAYIEASKKYHGEFSFQNIKEPK